MNHEFHFHRMNFYDRIIINCSKLFNFFWKKIIKNALLSFCLIHVFHHFWLVIDSQITTSLIILRL